MERSKIVDLFNPERDTDRDRATATLMQALTSQSVEGGYHYLMSQNIHLCGNPIDGWEIFGGGLNSISYGRLVIEGWLDRPENQAELADLLDRGVIERYTTL